MSNFKSQAKRKRELAKLDKRQAKDQKRALRKVEKAGVGVAEALPAAVAPIVLAPKPPPELRRQTVVAAAATAAPARKPLTLAEAVERWKSSKVAKPKGR